MKIYLAGPLFSIAEQEFNLKLCGKLEMLGHEVFLPQKYVAENIDFAQENWQKVVFEKNCIEIQNSDLIICILEGAIVDDGTAWEIGDAYFLKKEIYGLRTDFRIVGLEGQVNLMIGESIDEIFSSMDELIDFLVKNNKSV